MAICAGKFTHNQRKTGRQMKFKLGDRVKVVHVDSGILETELGWTGEVVSITVADEWSFPIIVKIDNQIKTGSKDGLFGYRSGHLQKLNSEAIKKRLGII